ELAGVLGLPGSVLQVNAARDGLGRLLVQHGDPDLAGALLRRGQAGREQQSQPAAARQQGVAHRGHGIAPYGVDARGRVGPPTTAAPPYFPFSGWSTLRTTSA